MAFGTDTAVLECTGRSVFRQVQNHNRLGSCTICFVGRAENFGHRCCFAACTCQIDNPATRSSREVYTSTCLLPFKKGTSTLLLPFRSQRMDTEPTEDPMSASLEGLQISQPLGISCCCCDNVSYQAMGTYWYCRRLVCQEEHWKWIPSA